MRSVAPLRSLPRSPSRFVEAKKSPQLLNKLADLAKKAVLSMPNGSEAFSNVMNHFDTTDYANENSIRQQLSQGNNNLIKVNFDIIAKLEKVSQDLYKKSYYLLTPVQKRYLASKEDLVGAGIN